MVQIFRQSAEPCAVPSTSPFMALLMEPLAVEAQALLSRCSTACGCTVLVLLRRGPECFCSRIIPPVSQSCTRCFNSASLSVPLGISANNKSISAQDGPRLVAADGSFKALCLRGGVPGDRAARKAIAQALRRSASRCLSCSVTTMSRIEQFGSGLSSKGSPGGTGCELTGGR